VESRKRIKHSTKWPQVFTISNSHLFHSIQNLQSYHTTLQTQTPPTMHFTTPALLALISTPLAFAAPSGSKSDYKSDCKKDWDAKWNSHDNSWKKNEKLFYFDAEYVVKATPDQVIATTGAPAPGQPGAKGLFKYGINIAENTICYNITLSGVTGEYASPALTATHIHEAAKGKAGPPRLVSLLPFSPLSSTPPHSQQ
jgi:hypothetical protein